MTLFRHSLLAIVLAGTALLSFNAAAFELALGPMPISLKHLPVPSVPGLLDGPDPIVVNKNAAIVLGKALFWDTNVGSDGMACASCHFHAGADGRVKNQLAPGGQSSPLSNQEFSNAMTGASLGPNHTLSAGDFPLHQREDPLQEHSTILYDTDNVVGSSGTFGGDFRAVDRYTAPNDSCSRSADSLFHAGAVGTRKVTSRNAPSVINAVFNHRNFWDGRANNVFNGSSPWGDRDPNAGVWVKQNATTLSKQRLHLLNSSLASLAVAPPQNTTEMACRNRTLMELGRKLLLRRPLQNQKVHPEDSVLGPYSLNTKPGMNTMYKLLVMQAFNPKYWSFNGSTPIPVPKGLAPYNQTEANFGMFFGLAIQLYESTLISDESPFDNSARDTGNQPIELSASELNGLKQFRKNQCALCHLGPNFSSASINANAAIARTHPEAFGEPAFYISASTNVVNRIPLFIQNAPVTAFFDTGFSSTGVTEAAADIGVGGVDDFGNPLSFSRQYLQYLAGNSAGVLEEDVSKVRACDFQEAIALNLKLPYSLPSLFTLTDGIRPQPQSTENCFLPASNAFLPTTAAALAELNKPNTKKMVAAVDSTFKIPSLRNIELTGPYMHNGSMATLEQAIEFYSRGGNFAYDSKQVTRVFPQPNLQLDAQNRADLIAFLKTLTDDRVRYEKAPFDHPEIKIPHGHVGTEQAVSGGNPLAGVLGKDQFLTIEAVGAQGNSSPIRPFEEYLAP